MFYLTSNCVVSSVGNPDCRVHAIALQDNLVYMCACVSRCTISEKEKKSNSRYVRCRQFKLSVKIFLAFLSHHRIELELLIRKNYFLALANTFFWSKIRNTRELSFFEKNAFFLEMCKVFYFILFSCF
jgi:hypothetical protein